MFRRLLIYDARASGRRSVRATDQHRGSRTGPARRRARLERRPLAVRVLLFAARERSVRLDLLGYVGAGVRGLRAVGPRRVVGALAAAAAAAATRRLPGGLVIRRRTDNAVDVRALPTIASPVRTLARTGLSFRIRRVEAFTRKEAVVKSPPDARPREARAAVASWRILPCSRGVLIKDGVASPGSPFV